MNMKDMLGFASVALLSLFIFNYFFPAKTGESNGQSRAGQVFTAPTSGAAIKPLALEVNFAASDKHVEPILTEIETTCAKYIFSTAGATLAQLTFKEQAKEKPILITTIADRDGLDRSNEAFLIALDDVTPYYYDLISQEKTPSGHELVYTVSFQGGTIEKKFIIADAAHTIDLLVTVKPARGMALTPRILYPSPSMPSIAKDDTVSALTSNEKDVLTKIAKGKLVAQQGWLKPTIFGSENKYFMHALFTDPSHFVARAYFKSECNTLISILEGPVVTEESQWKLGFYFGPKSEAAVSAVDKRLEGAVEYSGWLAPLARLLLMLLVFLNTYLHNYGLAIIAITLFIKFVFLPFTLRGQKGMKKQEDYQRKLAYINNRFKNDPAQLAKERAELIKTHGMPGMAGCLPLLLQIPIFFALQKVLSSSIELYHAPFLWIPDLSMIDPLYILPVLIALFMFLQALWAPASQRLSMMAMGLIFGAFATNFSAGLALYIAVNTAAQVLQSAVTGRA